MNKMNIVIIPLFFIYCVICTIIGAALVLIFNTLLFVLKHYKRMVDWLQRFVDGWMGGVLLSWYALGIIRKNKE